MANNSVKTHLTKKQVQLKFHQLAKSINQSSSNPLLYLLFYFREQPPHRNCAQQLSVLLRCLPRGTLRLWRKSINQLIDRLIVQFDQSINQNHPINRLAKPIIYAITRPVSKHQPYCQSVRFSWAKSGQVEPKKKTHRKAELARKLARTNREETCKRQGRRVPSRWTQPAAPTAGRRATIQSRGREKVAGNPRKDQCQEIKPNKVLMENLAPCK